MSSPFSKTPESLNAGLRRKDSKNALTTCHGITDKGRACRRPIAGSKAAYGLSGASRSGAMVIPQTADDPAIFFCWQHKDQAELLQFGGSEIVEVNGRTSLEEAFSRLGLEEVEEEEDEDEEDNSMEPTPVPSPGGRTSYDATPRLSSPDRFVGSSDQPVTGDRPRISNGRRRSSDYNQYRRKDSRYYSNRKPNYMAKDSESGFWAALLGGCFSDDERKKPKRRDHRGRRDRVGKPSRPTDTGWPSRHSPPPEVRRKPVANSLDVAPSVGVGVGSAPLPAAMRKQKYERPRVSSSKSANDQRSRRDSAIEGNIIRSSSERELQVYRDGIGTPREFINDFLSPPGPETSRPLPLQRKQPPSNSRSSQSSNTVGLWVPKAPVFMGEDDGTERKRKLDTYAKLLWEMNKAVTPKDGPGFIYIFWQTDVKQTDAETAAVASLISAPVNQPHRTEEELLTRRFFQTSANAALPPREKRTIFLKIGRAGNVHQRLSQWEKQCGYNISLLRTYPVVAHGRSAQMVPNVGKVENLIHTQLEMLGKRVKRQCRCGTLHREWFEIDATRDAIIEVDVLVQNWIKWSQDKDW